MLLNKRNRVVEYPARATRGCGVLGSRHRAVAQRRGGATAWCEQCAKEVHDLSSMREREVVALPERNAGRSICVSYRQTADGMVQTRRESAGRVVAGAAAALMGCAPQVGPTQPEEVQHVESLHDVDGSAVVQHSSSDSGDAEVQWAVTVNFEVDPRTEYRRGGILVREQTVWRHPDGRLHFVPTREILEDLRARWRARRR